MLIKFNKIYLLLLLLFFHLAFSAPQPNQISNGVNRLINQANLPAAIGIEIQDMQTGKVLYKRNSQQLFVPASNLKLFTGAAALLYLGPNYEFKTSLLTDGKSINNTLTGNLYLKFSGDPLLTSQQLNNLFDTLTKNNIQIINGNFYIDNTAYRNKPYGPGWMWDELNICYAAPIEAMMMDQNCVKAQLTPAPNINQLAQLTISNDLINVINRVQTAPADTSNCPLELNANSNNQYVLSGCIPLKSQPIDLQIAIKNPPLYLKNYVTELLLSKNIQLSGKVLFKTALPNLSVLATQNSEPLSEIVTEMMKQSNDPIANSLFLKMGEQFYKQPVRWDEAATAMQTVLAQQAKINFDQSTIVDGSGISRYNLVSAQQIAQLLYFSYHNPSIAPFFIASLPIAGKDGTLADRMTTASIAGKVKAKTGSMTGVSALSGYVTTTHQKTLAFVILINNFNKKDMEKAKSLEDHISEFLAKT